MRLWLILILSKNVRYHDSLDIFKICHSEPVWVTMELHEDGVCHFDNPSLIEGIIA